MTNEEITLKMHRFAQPVASFFTVRDVVYLSGPMTGRPDFNRPLFDLVKRSVQSSGATVLSPADLPQGASWEHQITKCVRYIADAHHILMLPGWTHSRGAMLEHLIASQIRIKRYYVLTEDKSTHMKASPYTVDCTDITFLTRFMKNDFTTNPATEEGL